MAESSDNAPLLPYSSQPADAPPIGRELFALALLHVALLAVVGPRLRLSQWHIEPENNQCAAEALIWLSGRLDLPTRGGDVAEYQGRYYCHFPPLMTLLCAAVYGTNQLLFGDPGAFYGLLYAALVALPIPTLFYFVFRRGGQPPGWSAVLTFGAIAGTCLWPVAVMAQRGWNYAAQHLLAQSGLAILLIDLLGRRRLWLAGLGLLMAAWSRQLTLLYAPALLWAAWTRERRPPATRAAALLATMIPLAITLALPMTLSAMKFGSPFESGYRYIYAGRDDALARIARNDAGEIEVFGPRFAPHNLYLMHLAPPLVDFSPLSGLQIQGGGGGTSLWITTPLLLFLLVDIRRWWRDRLSRVLVLCTLLVHTALMFYHFNGYDDPGYCRYTLDFTLVWLAAVAPGTGGWIVPPHGVPRLSSRGTVTLACIGWSVFYFYMVT